MPDATKLFQLYRNDVYRLAVSYTRSPQEAEDVCQSVFVKLLEAPSITPGKEKAWLMQVTANQCRNLLRSSWWRKTTAMEETLLSAEPQYSDLFQMIMAMPPQYRVVIYLRYYEELSTKEMAQLLHISQSAVTTRLNRARQKLKQQLQEVSL